MSMMDSVGSFCIKESSKSNNAFMMSRWSTMAVPSIEMIGLVCTDVERGSGDRFIAFCRRVCLITERGFREGKELLDLVNWLIGLLDN